MKDYTNTMPRGWILWLSIIAIILVSVGIFFYYSFFRQTKSELIEVVPTDALFIYKLNDYETLTKTEDMVKPYLDEMFAMNLMPAYEAIYDKLPKGNYDIIASGHALDNSISLLTATRMEKATFKKLLRSLRIDPANYTNFEQAKIYSYGTHFKSLKFTYVNHILILTDNLELLKKSLVQHKHPRTLMSDAKFRKLNKIIEKNNKQNWLVVNNPAYFGFLSAIFNEKVNKELRKIKDYSEWSAFQLRILKNEIYLSGYATNDNERLQKFTDRLPSGKVPQALIEFSADWYYKIEYPEYTATYFALTSDSLEQYKYLIIPQDTIHDTFSNLTSEIMEDLSTRYPDGKYPVADSTFTFNTSHFNKNDYQYFTIKNNHFLFAQSLEALDLYNNRIKVHGAIEENQFFKFAKSNLASQNLMEYTYFNPTNTAPLSRRLSEKGKTGQFGRDLKIFSISCNEVTDSYASVNLYFNFGR